MASPSSTEEHPNAKYNKKGPAIWTFVKNTAFLVTLLLFLLCVILMLDAYKFVSVRHANFARKKLFKTLQYMDPSLIESHSGFKVMTAEEFDKMNAELTEARGKIREANSELQERYSEVLKASVEVQGIKKEMEEIRKMNEENEEAKA
ncbi:hypothetical protein ACHAXN_005604 [Cyclotella atomus]|jgi:uncharacterized protein HemX